MRIMRSALLFRAEDLSCLDAIRSKGYDTGGPKFIKSIGQSDRAVIVQPGRVSFLYRRIAWLLSHEGV